MIFTVLTATHHLPTAYTTRTKTPAARARICLFAFNGFDFSIGEFVEWRHMIVLAEDAEAVIREPRLYFFFAEVTLHAS